MLMNEVLLEKKKTGLEKRGGFVGLDIGLCSLQFFHCSGFNALLQPPDPPKLFPLYIPSLSVWSSFVSSEITFIQYSFSIVQFSQQTVKKSSAWEPL